jgi:hypothetical protein
MSTKGTKMNLNEARCVSHSVNVYDVSFLVPAQSTLREHLRATPTDRPWLGASLARLDKKLAAMAEDFEGSVEADARARQGR